MQTVRRRVGRYEIHHEIGRGGMGIVYLATQTDLDRNVALKELGAPQALDPAFAARFLSESRIAGSLSHPNIVTVHDYFEFGGLPYIAMEYLRRGSLRPHVGKLTLPQIAGALEGLLAGLTHAEGSSVVHRDLKPENVMLTNEGSVKITDFGIAKAFNLASTGRFLTAAGTTVGTPAYMAPEQAMAKNLGPWTDLYSVGVLAYELLVGRVPFHDTETPMAILLRHVNEAVPPPLVVKPDLDPGLATWIEHLLQKQPEDRPQRAYDAWDELDEVVVRILGPRWRREARILGEIVPDPATVDPLPPAEFSEEVKPTPAPEPEPPPRFATYPPHETSGVADGGGGRPTVAPRHPPEPPEASAPEPEPTTVPATDERAEEPKPTGFRTYLGQRPRSAPVPEPVVTPEPLVTPAPLQPTGDGAIPEPAPVATGDVPAAEPELEWEEPVAETATQGEPVGEDQRTNGTPREPAATVAPVHAPQMPSFELPAPRRLPRRPSISRRTTTIAAGVVAAAVAAVAAFIAAGGSDEPETAKSAANVIADAAPSPRERAALAVTDSAVYAATAPGHVVALSPTRLNPLASVVDGASPTALAHVRGRLFVADERALMTLRTDSLLPRAAKPLAGRGAVASGTSSFGAVATADGADRGRLCRLADRRPGPCVRLPFAPSGVGVAPDGRLFVADGPAGTVVPYRTSSPKLVAERPLSVGARSEPHGRLIAFAGKLYVPVRRGVAVVDLETGRRTRIALPTTPSDIWIVPFNGRLFASLYAQNRIALVDVLSPSAKPTLIAVAARPVAVAGASTAQGGDSVYVLSAGGVVTSLDGLTGEVRRRARVAGLDRVVRPAVLGAVRFVKGKKLLRVRIAVDGGRLDRGGLRVVNASILDGSGALTVWQGGIGTATRVARGNGVSVTVSTAPAQAVIRLRARAGAFTLMRASISPEGNAIVITLTPKPKVVTRPSRPSPPDEPGPTQTYVPPPRTTRPTTTEPPPPPPPPPPPTNTGPRITVPDL